jgi:hypothetical protein
MRRALAGAMVAAAALAAAACGTSSTSGTVKLPAPSQAASASPDAPSPSPSPSAQAADTVTWPPFGADAKVILDPYTGDASTAGAVVTAKDMLLALEYAYYTGGKDTRWKSYVTAPKMMSDSEALFAQPDVTTESWTGTIKITHFGATLGIYGKNTALVSFCQNTSGARNTSLSTGKILPASDQGTGDQNYFSITYRLSSDTHGFWSVYATDPAIDYPRAPACKP